MDDFDMWMRVFAQMFKAVWYMFLLMFWAAVFVLWGIFAAGKGIYNLATRESFSKGIRAPRPRLR